ncbi:RusA family crossover junction endodeoxyribonuclease [Alkalihalophilus marmarensis]|uniref:RusA family crossover junction endodeoxyribonuclease n=1 Tax=Alkalihalophilus marmarensis TaxID=521377 RepID=UPI002DB9E1CD|nr:RusA family crossover junction endodeoxyribonuclease [Alkalihalophilus marmarensis]MEC2070323.1 RusA family crossover junction endodeoxyribonuclease [Alkalihalophilus marmarensis]
MIRFTIDGEPVAQGRPRAGKDKYTGRTRVYDPAKSKDFKQYVKLVASQYKPPQPLEGEINLVVKVFKSIPKSMAKYKQEMARNGELRPTTKPDVDNYVKGVKDGMNGIIWRDDSQVVSLTVGKWYSDNPRVEVEVKVIS